jgi:hypothetical protein
MNECSQRGGYERRGQLAQEPRSGMRTRLEAERWRRIFEIRELVKKWKAGALAVEV